MNLRELYRRLAVGELSNLFMSEESPGMIAEDKRPTILLHANNGILELHKRFVLLEKTILIQLQQGKLNYKLQPAYSISNAERSGVRRPYIIDNTCDPFEDEVIKVLSVNDECGRELPINDKDNVLSVFTPQPHILQVPFDKPGASLAISYQTCPQQLDGESQEDEIDIPMVLEKALTAYIASEVLGNINTQEANAKARDHTSRFEQVCLQVESMDLVSLSQTNTNTRFEKAGWA